MQPKYYIGLMSGTSLDGIDAGLYDFSDKKPRTISFFYQPYKQQIKQQIQELCHSQHTLSLIDYGELDSQLGTLYAQACLHLLQQAQVSSNAIYAIGSHGQTLYHAPHSEHPFTLQIGDPNIISYQTGITTIADFRRKDIAAGGQGAPLVPAFHQAVLSHPTENRVIVNIGGIANLSILNTNSPNACIGFDTGPGNTLLDYWINKIQKKSFDKEGSWAATGQLQTKLLDQLKDDPYFYALPPKSTGPEYFSPTWLKTKLATIKKYSAADIQFTLCQLTAESITDAIQLHAPSADKVFICGGGIHNLTLLNAIKKQLPMPVYSTAVVGIQPDQVEAMAFAWLAKQTLAGLHGNLPSVTGAKRAVILGGIYQA